MAKLMIKAIGGFALAIAYASGAWAACTAATDPGDGQVEVCVVVDVSYAGELFGAGSDDVVLSYAEEEAQDRDTTAGTPCVLDGTTNGPKVVIELPDGTAAFSGDAEIRYTLHGATFGQRVSNTDLQAMHNAGSISARVIEGGAPGDSSVIFEVEATDFAYSATWDPDGTAGGACDAADHERVEDDLKALLAFAVPPLTEASAALRGRPSPAAPGVLVSVEVDGTSVSGFPRYPARQQVYARDANMDGEKDADNGVRLLLGKSGMNAVSVTAGNGATGTISPESRETLLISTAVPFPLNPQQLTVASVSVGVNGTLHESDGSPFSVEDNTGRRNDGDGAGSLLVHTTGDFRDGDMLFWDANGNGRYDAGMEIDTMMDMSNGSAMADFSLDDESLSGGAIIYVPNGKDPLRSGRIATTVSVDYTLSTNATPQPAVASANLNYAGAEDALLAYAIAPPSNPDDSNIRVRCDKSTPCQVYFACDGADGSGYFGKMDGMIGGRMVDTINADELADVIGADDMDFMGRMSCEVIGTGISVQVLTRSGDALVNNTYVGGPLEAQVRDAINEAKAATAAAGTAGDTAETVRCAQVMSANPDDESTADMNETNDALMAANCPPMG